jgi:2,3-dimethylmalate lyase
MAVRRMIRECIRLGIAGIRIDDQPIEGKRKTQSAGVEVMPLDQAIARYRAAVDMKNELDPNFVVMAQCYARDATDGTLEDTIARLRAYREEAGVNWVQFESPHSVDEFRAARAVVEGPFSFMKGRMLAAKNSRKRMPARSPAAATVPEGPTCSCRSRRDRENRRSLLAIYPCSPHAA